MLKDGIIAAVQSVTRQPKWSRDPQHSTLSFTGLDGLSKWTDQIMQQVTSNPSTNMNASTIIQITLEANKYPSPFFSS